MAATPAPRYIVGIDLGTTNTVVAFVDTQPPPGTSLRVELFPVEQPVAAGQVAPRPMLPSVRYHAAPGELPGDADVVIGEFARELGGRVPGRLVVSAKSWLCHPDVDRSAAILPWGAPDDVPKVSPVQASASYLALLRAAWDHDPAHRGHPLAEQDVVLTVPASFDDDARQLTVRAAESAGLPKVRLIEEPQAAVYDWLWRHQHDLAPRLSAVRLVLVVDVGGGTSDFSLVRVEMKDAGPRLTRTAVGDHLMLGGDNMDLALARTVEARLGGAPLSSTQLAALIQQCRVAKERLLEPRAPGRATVTLLGGGGRLVGGARSAELTRDEVLASVLDGFFPRSGPDDAPARRQAAIREFGLPFVADPAVTRHIAAFLRRHAAAAREALGETGRASTASGATLVVPDGLLLNGGVFRAGALAGRIHEVLADWRGGTPVLLENPDPELAVARGAAAYGLARRGTGVRIGGGSARSFFLLAEGRRRGSREAVCIVPRGIEEGEEIALPDRSFALRLGRPVEFHVASTSSSRYFAPGSVVDGDDAALAGMQNLPPLVAVLESARRDTAGAAALGAGDAGDDASERSATVGLVTQLTEVGTLELHCVAAGDPRRRWGLEFAVRGSAAGSAAGASHDFARTGPDHAVVIRELHPRLPEAKERVQRVFTRARGTGAEVPKEAKGLRRDLESLLGARETWNTPLLRELFGVLWAGAKRRRRTADHERSWLNLAGWCLRPGFGFPLDDWRVREVQSLHEEGLQYARETRVWAEWWTFWRRIAGGLDENAQEKLFATLEPHVGRKASPDRKAGAMAGTVTEMVRLAASLERIAPSRKTALGERLLARSAVDPALAYWALGRAGARVPFHGSAHAVVPRRVAEEWLVSLCALDWASPATPGAGEAAFAAALIARRTGDRERDVPDALRERVAGLLERGGFPSAWAQMVREVAELEEREQRLVFGEALPPGLRLVE